MLEKTALVLGVLLLSCNTTIKNRHVSESAQFWQQFMEAVERKDIPFLVAHSADTIKCADCVVDGSAEGEMFPSELIFSRYLRELMRYDSIKSVPFIIHEDDNSLIINYKFEESEGHNVIYYFKKIEGGYRFQGMIVT